MLDTNLETFGTVDHHAHRKLRAANSLFFSRKSISAAEPLIHRQLTTLCDVLRNSGGKCLELRINFLAFTSDESRPAEDVDRTITAVATVAPSVKQSPWLIGYAMAFPHSGVKIVLPTLAKVLHMNKVLPALAGASPEYET